MLTLIVHASELCVLVAGFGHERMCMLYMGQDCNWGFMLHASPAPISGLLESCSESCACML